ncbi:MAG: hypothetical protein HY737_04970 [Candidatus Omnitrophica bacterium]|nr:hypothetical protein [Candidatus Omnitrophota bacterium]
MPPVAASGIYLFVGSDRPAKLQRIRALEQSLGIHPLDRHHIDAAAISTNSLLALCRQHPAASRLRLVIVEAAQRLTASIVEALHAQSPAIAKTAVVVLIVDAELSVRHPLARPPASMVVESFSPHALGVPKPFALTDALGQRQVAAALDAAVQQLRHGKEPLELLGLIAWQLQRWVTVKRLAELGHSVEAMARATGWNAWQVERASREVAARSLRSLQQLLARCWQLDIDAKQGRTLPELALEQLIIESCVVASE